MYRILIVEDTKIQRQALAKVLSGAGYEPISAATAGAGLKACAQQKPDLVLLDVNLPDGFGIDVCRTLKGDPRLRHIPVLMLTGDRLSVEDRLEGLEAGADDYVLKPYETAELLLRVQGILNTVVRRARPPND